MRFKKLIVAILAVCSAACMTPQTLNAQSTLNNDAIIKLVKAGLSEDLIVSTINSQPGTYNTSTDGLIALKKAGVSDKVVGAMVIKGFTPAPVPVSAAAPVQVASNPDDPAQAHAPGIYILAAGSDRTLHLTKLDHVVPKEVKTSGTLGMAFTYGIKKAHVLVALDGPKATIQTLDTNPTFYAYIPDDNTTFGGSSITVKDFSLIKFDVKKQQREANVTSMGITGASAGADEKSLQAFTSEVVKPGVYKLTLAKPLLAGEYAFQQSGAQGSSPDQKNTGSYFDFGVAANQ
jgi:predicted small secreted protein